jgi:hypothetical protein
MPGYPEGIPPVPDIGYPGGIPDGPLGVAGLAGWAGLGCSDLISRVSKTEARSMVCASPLAAKCLAI